MTFSQTYNDVLNSTKNRTNTAPYVYDAIWIMANILERARPVLEKKGKVLNNLSYGEETELLERLAYETDFNGVTVRTTNGILSTFIRLLYFVVDDDESDSLFSFRVASDFTRTMATGSLQWMFFKFVEVRKMNLSKYTYNKLNIKT